MPGKIVPRAGDDRGATQVTGLVSLGLHRFNLRLHRRTSGKTGATTLTGDGARVLNAICHVLILGLNIPPARFA